MLVNFCGLRHLTERVIPNDAREADSAIASHRVDRRHRLDGRTWSCSVELLATPDFDGARAWCEAHPAELANAYGLSKEAINVYTAMRSFAARGAGHPHQLPEPGPDRHADDAGVREGRRQGRTWTTSRCRSVATRSPTSRRGRCVFLNSPRASFVTGVQLDADGGFKGALFTGQIDPSVLMPPE